MVQAANGAEGDSKKLFCTSHVVFEVPAVLKEVSPFSPISRSATCSLVALYLQPALDKKTAHGRTGSRNAYYSGLLYQSAISAAKAGM